MKALSVVAMTPGLQKVRSHLIGLEIMKKSGKNIRMAWALLTLKNLESRRAENDHQIDPDWNAETTPLGEINKAEDFVDTLYDINVVESGVISSCSELNFRSKGQLKHEHGARKSALVFWRNIGNKRPDGPTSKFDSCAFVPKPGKQISKLASSSGLELDCLASLNTVRNGHRMIQNYVSRQGDERYKTFRKTDLRSKGRTVEGLVQGGTS